MINSESFGQGCIQEYEHGEVLEKSHKIRNKVMFIPLDVYVRIGGKVDLWSWKVIFTVMSNKVS